MLRLTFAKNCKSQPKYIYYVFSQFEDVKVPLYKNHRGGEGMILFIAHSYLTVKRDQSELHRE